MAESQHTKEQHFIPQEYLRGFSQDSKTVFEYYLPKDKAIDDPVSIKDICKEKYLYELRDEQDVIININYLENIFCQYEGLFSDYRKTLLNKAVHRENYNILSFLTKKEKVFWIFYSTLNMMRNPGTLNRMKGFIQNETSGMITDQQAKNLAIEYCLPFFPEPDTIERNMFSVFLSVLSSKVLSVGYTEGGNLFTSDHAMYGSQRIINGFPYIERLWFPISSNCALVFAAPETINGKGKNCLFPLSDENIRNINKGIAYIAKQYVLSKYPFTNSDIALIREARQEKAQEEALKQTK